MRALSGRLICVVVALYAGMLYGCGGGGSGGSGGGGGGPADSRALLLDEVSEKLETFTGANQDAENQQMLAFMQTKPDFTATGIDDSGAVWGRFADGTTLVVGNNLIVTGKPRRTRASSVRTRLNGIPSSLKVMIGTSLGSLFDDANQDIFDMFDPQQYDRVQPDFTVDALKTLNNVSVLCLTGHGATVPLVNGGGRAYCLWTATDRARDGSTDTKYQADLRDGSLTYFMSHTYVSDSSQQGFHRGVATRYAITAKFVQKYWTGGFHKNSIVFINACRSGKSFNDFEVACLDAGASAYLGWTERVLASDAPLSAAYLFDRLLGANVLDAEVPKQRPFTLFPVLVDMSTRKRLDNNSKYDSSFNPQTGLTAKLEALSLNSEFGLLAPSIENLEVDEQKDELYINGTFGDVPGTVDIGNTGLTVKKWTPNRITCNLPRTGGDASGDVTVQVNSAQRSNAVQLTEWHGTATCTMQGKGTLKIVMNFNLRFRADVHSRRISPYETPFTLGSGYLHSLASSGTFQCSGAYDSPDGLYHEDWSGSGQLPARVTPLGGPAQPEENNVVYQGNFDEDRKWLLAIRAIGVKGNHIHSIQRDTQGMVIFDKIEDADAIWLNVDDLNGNASLLTVDANFNIPAGTRTRTINSEESMTMTWSAMSSNHPPAANAARSAKVNRRSR